MSGVATATGSWAVLSDDGLYRYRLGRRWADQGPTDVWVMLNPSTADADVDDRTIGRCREFSKGWGAASLIVVNLFALRSTDPDALLRHPDPIGPDNDEHIAMVAAGAQQHGGRVLAAWGAHPMAGHRGLAVHRVIRQQAPVMAMGTTKAGAPKHPLYLKGDTMPEPWGTR